MIFRCFLSSVSNVELRVFSNLLFQQYTFLLQLIKLRKPFF